MQARMDTQQQRLDSLEGLLDVMAVEIQLCRELWRRDEQLSDEPAGSRQNAYRLNPSANYFDDDDVGL
ncbi:hypothetical protein Bca101_075815 [Brassica carinata]